MPRLLLALAFVAVACHREPPPKPYRSVDGGFSVLMPGNPVDARTTHSGAFGFYDERSATVEMGAEDYTVGWFEFSVQRLPSKLSFAETQKALEGKGFKVLASADLASGFDGLAGRELRLGKDGTDTFMRMYAIGRRAFVLSHAGPESDAAKRHRAAFFASFQPDPEMLRSMRALHVCAPFDCRDVSLADGSFTLSLPKTPKETMQARETPEGVFDEHAFVAISVPVALGVSYVDLPFRPPEAPKLDVPAIARALAIPAKARLEGKSSAKLGEFDATEFTLKSPENTLPGENEQEIRVRAAQVGRRLYLVSAAFPEGELRDDELDTYFASFRTNTAAAATR